MLVFSSMPLWVCIGACTPVRLYIMFVIAECMYACLCLHCYISLVSLVMKTQGPSGALTVTSVVRTSYNP